MTSAEFELSTKEHKARKHWLIVSALLKAILPFLLLLLVVVHFSLDMATKKDLAASLIRTLFELIFFCALYYCTYLQHGTRLLTFSLFLSLTFGVLSVIAILYVAFANSFGGIALPNGHLLNSVLSTLIETLFEFLVLFWWCASSWKLRKINQKIRFQKASKEGYERSMSALQMASNLHELDDEFARLIKEFPQFEPVLSREYKAKKAEF